MSKRKATATPAGRPSALIDMRVIYCGDPPFSSNRNYEVFWGETKEKRAFENRHASTQAYINYMRPRCVELPRVLEKTGSFYYHCEWRASRSSPIAPTWRSRSRCHLCHRRSKRCLEAWRNG